MEIISVPLKRSELQKKDAGYFADMIKAVVDVERGLLAINGELHADLEALLLDDGSRQESLWGINLYPDEEEEDFLEFDSLINIRPWQGNRSRGVEDFSIQEQIKDVVRKWIVQ